MFDKIKAFVNPTENPDLTPAQHFQRKNLSSLWLLGKTGAGKSSFVQAMTGLSDVDVGNGFEPCTVTAFSYEFPTNKPILRFIDTRGLGEAGYDPAEDIKALGNAAHALLVVMKTDEPEQSSVMKALQKIKKQKKIKNLLVIHTGFLSVDEKTRERQLAFNQKQVEEQWGKPVDYVTVDFEMEDGGIYHYEELLQKLASMLPIVGMMVEDKEHASVEAQNFDKVENEILWYAGTASASDLIPAVGIVSVPAIQAKMLHSLANQYGIEWNKQTFSELIGTLGSSFALQYGVKLGARQLVKLIPGYGQTVGAIAAAALSFGTTYGLGRASCYYFYQKRKGEPVSSEAMQAYYYESLKKGKAASGYDVD